MKVPSPVTLEVLLYNSQFVSFHHFRPLNTFKVPSTVPLMSRPYATPLAMLWIPVSDNFMLTKADGLLEAVKCSSRSWHDMDLG